MTGWQESRLESFQGRNEIRRARLISSQDNADAIENRSNSNIAYSLLLKEENRQREVQACRISLGLFARTSGNDLKLAPTEGAQTPSRSDPPGLAPKGVQQKSEGRTKEYPKGKDTGAVSGEAI